MGTAQDGGCSSSALAMCTVIPARCWKHKRTGRAGGGGNLENRQWGWREKSIGNEASLVWLPVGQLVNWLIPLFPLSSWVLLKIIFLPMMLSRKRPHCSLQNLWQCHYFAEWGGTANMLFLMFRFNLADAFSVNCEPRSSCHWFNECVDTDIPNPTFPDQEHISLETTEPAELWVCFLINTGLMDFSGEPHVGWGLCTYLCVVHTYI